MKTGKKLIVSMALIAIVPSLIIALVVNSQMENSIHNLQRKSLQSLANVVSAHVYDFCNGQEMDSRFFGQVTAYRECLAAHERGDASETGRYWDGEVRSLFDRTTTINDNIDGGALIDADGTVILSYDRREEGRSVANTDMYRKIMNGAEIYRNTVINEDGSRNINLVVPVKNDAGSVVGLLKRVVNLSNLNLYIDEVEIGETGYVYMIDETATLIYHGMEEKMDLAVGEFQDREELDELMSQVSSHTLKKKTGIIHYDNRGVDTIAAYSQIKGLDWVVLVAMDNAEIQGPADKTTRTIAIASILVGLIAALACYFIVQSLLLPLADLKKQMKQIAEGDYSDRCVFESSDELAILKEQANDIAARLERDERELARARSRDDLTGMCSRREALSRMGERLGGTEKQALLLLDMDDFSVINDTMGQNVGDGVLVEFAQRIKELPECVVCTGRYSGDCFILMLEDWDEETDPELLALRIRKEAELIRFVEERPVHISASIGIVYIDDSELELEDYLKRAENVLYKAKRSGKNTDVVFSDEV